MTNPHRMGGRSATATTDVVGIASDEPRRFTGQAARPVEELLAGATFREPLKTADSLSSATFERVVIDGQRLVVKYLSTDEDWIMRASGDVACRPLVLWESGFFDTVPAFIDHTVVGVARDEPRRGAAVLMRDVGRWLVPEGSALLPLEQHLRFLDHMARLHAHYWGWTDTVGLMPMGSRYLMLSPLMAAVEAERGSPHPVPAMVPAGWRRLPEVAPRAAEVALPLLEAPWPLVDAVARTPATFCHCDWKAGNLGSHPDGRTILIDWAYCGEAPACVDLAWYLAVNCDRLPQSKEDAIAAYRRALVRAGVDVTGWWDAQLALCLLGAFLLLGWSKALGDPAELAWWEERVADAVRYLR